jgi:hypothetical protein
LSDTQFRLVVNAGTRDKDLAWIRAHAGPLAVSVVERATWPDRDPARRPRQDDGAHGAGRARRSA